jgi:hypothetical protein
MGAAPPFKLRSIVLDPAVHRGVIDREPAFEHHLFEIPIAERIAKVPPDAQKNDVGLKMTPLERIRFDHDGKLLCYTPNKEEFSALSTKICYREEKLIFLSLKTVLSQSSRRKPCKNAHTNTKLN